MRQVRFTLAESFFFLNDTATPEISPLPLHDALPIFIAASKRVSSSGCAARYSQKPWPWMRGRRSRRCAPRPATRARPAPCRERSEEHTSELQSRQYLVCRLLLEKKKLLRAAGDGQLG